MARSTFDGPVLSGDNRFGPLRDVGYTRLTQYVGLDFSNTTANTANYSGASGQFVVSNDIPNGNGVVYTPSSSVYPPAAATPTADAAAAIYRGWVAYVPVGSRITAIDFDIGVFPTVAAGTVTSVQLLAGNAFNNANYAQSSAITSGTGRQTVTYSTAQLANCQATSADITNSPQPSLFSQVVCTLAVVGTSMTTLATGKFYITLSYTQADGSIGTTTAYPYGNLD